MKFICTSVFILSAYFLFGQQETIFNHFWNNQTHFNPAFAGLEYRHQAGALYRSQWQNVNGVPEDIYGFYNARLIDHLGVGINFNYGTIGFRTSYNIAIPIAYHLQLNDNAELSLEQQSRSTMKVLTQILFHQRHSTTQTSRYPTNSTY